MKSKTVYVCSECDYQSPKWLGQCPSCKKWNTFSEETYTQTPEPKNKRLSIISESAEAVKFEDMEVPKYIRSKTGIGELDRVLGGGIVSGSVILLAGEPGIGKSTLLMQICARMPTKVLYVSGEESTGQLKLRATRLEIEGANTYFMTETNVDNIIAQTDKIKPEVIIIDSIQTMFDPASASSPGSVNQVKECAVKFIAKAKSQGISIILVGHVNKEGIIAGPKVLEHMVDAVLYFEGDRNAQYRVLRAVKNRFGSAQEVGVFEMTDSGIQSVSDYSNLFLSQTRGISAGSAVTPAESGNRCMNVEIQTLVSKTAFSAPRRMSLGIDYNKLVLLIAVLEKRCGIPFYNADVYLNAMGGIKLNEPSTDLAVCSALASGATDTPIDKYTAIFGEVGLTGEIRPVNYAEKRVNECIKAGFKRVILPAKNKKACEKYADKIELVPVQYIGQLMKILGLTPDNK